MSAVEEIIGTLSLAEIAVLESTNDPIVSVQAEDPASGSQPRRGVLLTTKDAYYWAAALSVLVENGLVTEPEEFQEIFLHTVGSDLVFRSVREDHRLLSYLTSDLKTLSYQLIRNAGVKGDASVYDIAEGIVPKMVQAERELISKGLIEDPIELMVGGITLAALGLIPIGWTRKTQQGKLVAAKINALFWKYERTTVGDTTTTNAEFQLLRILKAFHSGVIGSFKKIMDDYSAGV